MSNILDEIKKNIEGISEAVSGTKERDPKRADHKGRDKKKAEANEEVKVRYDEAEGIDERVLRAITEMGFEYMSPIQRAAIPVMMKGVDIIGQAQTGTGKTAAFGIPLLQKIDPDNRHLQAVVLCPTRELAMQAADDIRSFGKYMHGIKVLPVYGGQDISRQIRALSSGVQIVVGTPGRVMDHMRRHTMKMNDVRVLVLDEADEMLDMGFRDDIETILDGMPEEKQTALFSATMPEPILQITRKYQHDAEYIKMTPKEITVKSIEQYYYVVPSNYKEEVLTRLIEYHQPVRSLVFCNTKRKVDELTGILKNKGYRAEGLHGDLSQFQRDTVMNLFRFGQADFLIATDVAARGIDVSGVTAVFNYDIPEDIEYYVHRIGRTGRAGKSGQSFSLVSPREMYKLRDIERICHTKIEEGEIPSAKEITRAKARKIFAEVIDLIEAGEITDCLEFLNDKVAEDEYSIEQLAAGLMRLKMGKAPEELDLKPRKRDIYRGQRSRDRREGRGGRFEKDSHGRRDGQGRGDGKGRRDGKGSGYGRSRDGKYSKDRGMRDASPMHKKASADKFRRNARPRTEKLGVRKEK
ncbi:ATP-dependent RNA helicase DeaD [Butyrivibrio sp. ob235]|uniref:DEAD/DEAH box helicase n=1 Tax=Butyrivibrio sp. ob235 TaxID=1761780 RepID=UPI0008C9821D|nr:DEAD/DEAH box helicase [Butyrivibrio sp. ob235]SEK39599.1 ATP-dependent RNA helicase DeaD [Butyrivibrio sp. ob235]